MAKYFRDFTEDSVGAQPTGFAEALNSGDAQWLITSVAGATNGVALRASKTGGGSGDSYVTLLWTALGLLGSGEIAIRFRYNATFNVQTPVLWLSALVGPPATGYFGEVTSGGSRGIFRQTSHSSAPVGAYLASAAGSALTRDAWYGMRLRASGSSRKMRIWLWSNPEPSTWDIDTTDASPLANGYPGLGALMWPAGDATRYFDFDLVGFTTSPSTESAPLANIAPATPTATVASGTTSGVQITGSAFSTSITGNTHAHSQFRVLLASDNSVVYDSGSVAASVGPHSASGLTAGTAYKAQVRYQDQRGDWSAYGTSANFTIPPIRLRFLSSGVVQARGASAVDAGEGPLLRLHSDGSLTSYDGAAVAEGATQAAFTPNGLDCVSLSPSHDFGLL